MMIVRAEYEVERILRSRAFPGTAGIQDKKAHLAYAVRQVTVNGLWLEFGVSTGGSLRWITAHTDQMVYGFDWFQGLPEAWVLGRGYTTYSCGAFAGQPTFGRRNVTLVRGLFRDTVPAFLRAHPGPIAFVHVDCDLYTSTRVVLKALQDRLVVGSVLAFDELFNYPNYAEHEMRALLELQEETGLEYEYLAHTPDKTAASLRMTGISTRFGVSNTGRWG
jgi:hypothetical protein